MSVASIATAAVASRHAQVQLAVAAKLAKHNHQSQAAIADLVEAAGENLQKLATAAQDWVGQLVDISA